MLSGSGDSNQAKDGPKEPEQHREEQTHFGLNTEEIAAADSSEKQKNDEKETEAAAPISFS